MTEQEAILSRDQERLWIAFTQLSQRVGAMELHDIFANEVISEEFKAIVTLKRLGYGITRLAPETDKQPT